MFGRWRGQNILDLSTRIYSCGSCGLVMERGHQLGPLATSGVLNDDTARSIVHCASRYNLMTQVSALRSTRESRSSPAQSPRHRDQSAGSDSSTETKVDLGSQTVSKHC